MIKKGENMPTFDDLDSSFEEGRTDDFIKISSKLKSVNNSQDGEPRCWGHISCSTISRQRVRGITDGS